MTPWLSVIMPTYNGERYVAAALESIAAQRDPAIEVVVVDDGSTDSTRARIDEYQDSLRLRIIDQRHGGNWVASTNRGLEEATGHWASFLHQDDLWAPARARAVRPYTEEEPALIVHPVRFIDEGGDRVGSWKCPLPAERSLDRREVLPLLLVQNFISVVGTVFQRSDVLASGGLDPDLWYTADWDLWLRLAARESTIHVPRFLGAYRIHAAALTQTGSADQQGFRAQLERVLDRHLPGVEPPERAPTERLARLSIEVNAALATAAHSQYGALLPVVGRAIAVGPRGLTRYLRASRIAERAWARVRARSRRRLSGDHRARR